jgi:hypothetical protein
MDEIVLRMTVDAATTGGQVPEVAHHVRHIKNIIEAAEKRGQLPGVKVVGYEMRNLSEMTPSKPRKEVSV